MMRVLVIFIMVVFMASFVSADQGFLGENKEYVIGDYVVQHLHDNSGKLQAGELITVSKDGKELYRREGYRFFIEKESDDSGMNKFQGITIGSDVTGNDLPNIVIEHWGGGNTFLTDLICLELGDDVRAIVDRSDSIFTDEDSDGILEIMQYDRNYSYWYVDGANSPYPTLIFKYIEGAYEPAYEMMKNRELTPRDEMIAKIRGEKDGHIENPDGFWHKGDAFVLPPVLWALTEYTYAGKLEEAKTLLDEVWEYDEPSKQAYWNDYLARLKESPFWDVLKQLNGL
jgi:hypothetical protein